MNVQKHLARECNREFGPNHEHDERECAIVLGNMSSDAWEDGYYLGYDYPAYDPQTDHFERFGRPAFPNEY